MENLKYQKLVRSYCAYLNQSEFAERYLFIKSRITNGMTREELAFLLGRVPYFIIDYEELSAIKLDLPDIDFMNIILKVHYREALNFDTKEGVYDISNEKRLVRVIKSEYSESIMYEFHHHWKINGKNKLLKIIEPVIYTDGLEMETTELIVAELTKLMELGYFKIKRSPLEIRNHIWKKYRYKSSAWSITLLKNIIYEWIRQGKLTVGKHKGHFMYQAV